MYVMNNESTKMVKDHGTSNSSLAACPDFFHAFWSEVEWKHVKTQKVEAPTSTMPSRRGCNTRPSRTMPSCSSSCPLVLSTWQRWAVRWAVSPGATGSSSALEYHQYHLQIGNAAYNNYIYIYTYGKRFIYRWFTYKKWWFSMAVLNNQRVTIN